MTAKTTLIRLHKYKVDQVRQKLAGLEAMKVELMSRRSQLDETLERERVRAKDSDIGRLAFPTFLQSVRARQENLQRSADELEDQIAEVREELNEAFRELKTFETAEAVEHGREMAAEARAEQIELDDLAIETHRRNAL